MSPKIALWIGFSLLSGTWYALDPEAHVTSAQSFAAHTATQIEQVVRVQAPESPIKTAMK